VDKRKRKSDEMPAEHALLGLLAMSDGSRHGYDLARAFQPDSELGEIIKLEPGMLYHHLKKLERLGWVTSRQEQVDRRPARSVYTLTENGRTELRNWMTEPVEHTREIRLAFLVKLFLARQSDPARAKALIEEQIATLERVEGVQREMRETGSFSGHVRDLRLAQTRTAIAWLRSLQD
jgi:DNA-binding PadR family transcriptional regulator